VKWTCLRGGLDRRVPGIGRRVRGVGEAKEAVETVLDGVVSGANLTSMTENPN